MIGLILVVAGLALILGAKDFSREALKVAAGLILVLSLLPSALNSCGRHSTGSLPTENVEVWLGLAMLAALALVGFVFWHRRDSHAGAAKAELRRHSKPRERALPPSPLSEDDADGSPTLGQADDGLR